MAQPDEISAHAINLHLVKIGEIEVFTVIDKATRHEMDQFNGGILYQAIKNGKEKGLIVKPFDGIFLDEVVNLAKYNSNALEHLGWGQKDSISNNDIRLAREQYNLAKSQLKKLRSAYDQAGYLSLGNGTSRLFAYLLDDQENVDNSLDLILRYLDANNSRN